MDFLCRLYFICHMKKGQYIVFMNLLAVFTLTVKNAQSTSFVRIDSADARKLTAKYAKSLGK